LDTSDILDEVQEDAGVKKKKNKRNKKKKKKTGDENIEVNHKE
jgi:hypothetical protein